MRIRISTTPPLPPHKAWFVPPAGLSEDLSASVLDLKNVLCGVVNALNEHAASEIALFMEGFELLDDTPLEVIQNGDLVVIKSTTPRVGEKRKRPDSHQPPVELPAKRSRLLLTNGTPPAPQAPATKKLTQSSINSSAKDSDSSSSSDSDSDSSSSSDSSTSSSGSSSSPSDTSSSSSSSAPSALPTKKPAIARAAVAKPDPLAGYTQPARAVPTAESCVPPGEGTSSTKARNARRRRQRKAAKQSSFGIPQPQDENTADATMAPVEQAQQSAPLPVQVTSTMLRNKTNRKTFLTSAPDDLPGRIIFDNAQPRRAGVNAPRLIPPSERTNLPFNLFVTSVDVEADLWPKRRRKQKQNYLSFTQDRQPEQDNTFPQLSYGDDEEEDITDAAPKIRNKVPGVGSEVSLEVRFPTLQRVLAPPPVGTVLTWKELGINPTTLTPEMLTRSGRVVLIDAAVQSVKLSVSNTSVAFGATGLADEDDDIAMPEEEEVEEKLVSLAEIIGRDDWRVVV